MRFLWQYTSNRTRQVRRLLTVRGLSEIEDTLFWRHNNKKEERTCAF
jgi:hypothetical protein